MTLELSLIIGFLLHLIGDYLTQTHWMAVNKTKHWDAALIHACLYSIPFWTFLGAQISWGYYIILFSHLFIDRFRIAEYWIRMVNWNWKGNNHGYPENTPPYLSTWLLIIIDNVIHIVINSATIIYFYNGDV